MRTAINHYWELRPVELLPISPLYAIKASVFPGCYGTGFYYSTSLRSHLVTVKKNSWFLCLCHLFMVLPAQHPHYKNLRKSEHGFRGKRIKIIETLSG